MAGKKSEPNADLVLKAARRLFAEEYHLNDPQQPDEGAYWWLPIPAKSESVAPNRGDVSWRILPFLASEYENVPGETTHEARWPEVVRVLEKVWGIPTLRSKIGDCHVGLPRGRISMNNEGGYSVDHGSNNPPGTDMAEVARKFGIVLGGSNHLEAPDPRYFHYDLNMLQLKRIETALGRKLGLIITA